MRKDYAVGLNITETAVDDPDPAFYENYVRGASSARICLISNNVIGILEPFRCSSFPAGIADTVDIGDQVRCFPTLDFGSIPLIQLRVYTR
jgi:hypothetical protein